MNAIEKLRAIAHRDTDGLDSGDEILLVHAGHTSTWPIDEEFTTKPSAHAGTVSEVRLASVSELYPFPTHESEERNSVLFYMTDLGSMHIYAADCGLQPYESGMVNRVNFIVKADRLEEVGMTVAEAIEAVKNG